MNEAALRAVPPVILFIPGFTSWKSALDLKVTKPKYFQNQREHFKVNLAREVLYLNTPTSGGDYSDFIHNNTFGFTFTPSYDSDDTTVCKNARQIGMVIRELGGLGRRVTIVSHSKGGQDVLHALLEGEEKDCGAVQGVVKDAPKAICMRPLIAGWVALTSNFFEGEFKITQATSPGLPGHLLTPADQFGNITLETCSGNRYANYHVDPEVVPNVNPGDAAWDQFRPRQKYMANMKDKINQLLTDLPIVNVFARVNLGSPVLLPLPLTIERFAFRIQKQSDYIENTHQSKSGICGANDGIVPARAAQLPGVWRLEVALNDGATGGYGVDHLAVALTEQDYWTTPWRNARTVGYVKLVEYEDRARYLAR